MNRNFTTRYHGARSKLMLCNLCYINHLLAYLNRTKTKLNCGFWFKKIKTKQSIWKLKPPQH